MNKPLLSAVLSSALFLSAAPSQALDGQLYGQIGFSDYGYSDGGIGLKLGGDFANNLAGFRHLGLTAFYAYTNANNHNYNNNDWSYSTHTFALGPTFTYPIQGSKLAVQGRAFLEMDVQRWGYAGNRHSDVGMDIGLGFGAQYALDNKLSLRIDYDLLGNSVDMLSLGVGMKF